jgi:hypothetical protein
MPPYRLPITRTVTDPDPGGPIRTVLRAAVRVEALTPSGLAVGLDYAVIDTGASYTTMSAVRARGRGLAVPAESSRTPLTTAGGRATAVVHDGQLRVRSPQFSDQVYTLYCLFSEAMPPATPLLLGLNNFIDLFRVTFDGRYAPDAPAGHVLLEPADASP